MGFQDFFRKRSYVVVVKGKKGVVCRRWFFLFQQLFGTAKIYSQLRVFLPRWKTVDFATVFRTKVISNNGWLRNLPLPKTNSSPLEIVGFFNRNLLFF